MKAIFKTHILRVIGSLAVEADDALTTEEPMEIRIGVPVEGTPLEEVVAVTMRTPGDDEDLALGFLFTEGLISGMEQVAGFRRSALRRQVASENAVVVELAPGYHDLLKGYKRHFISTSACGVCGKDSIESVFTRKPYELPLNAPRTSPDVLHQLPTTLLNSQHVFGSTGGLHAAALFSPNGELLMAREDIGRHNALDKLIGAALRQGSLPLQAHILLVSGRAGFELVQKAIMAGIPIMAAVGAPSHLAVELARQEGMTLIGFLRNGQFNVYSGAERLDL